MNLANLDEHWLFFALPLVWFLGSLRAREREKRLTQFADAELLSTLCLPVQVRRNQNIRYTCFLTLLAAALIATLLRPQWGFEWKESKRRGSDIVLAVDVSDSMLAKDVSPNRLERARREITDLLEMLRGDRVSLVSFAGVAFVETPLTLDYAAFRMFLGMLDSSLIPVKGSNIEAALKKSLEALGVKEGAEVSSRRNAAILLITDGEELEGDLSRVSQLAKSHGVKIFVMGVGTTEGAPIPSAEGYKKTQDGRLVISRLHPDTLEAVARETEGSYVQSISSTKDTEAIYRQGIKRAVEESELQGSKSKHWREYFQLPLLMAVILLIIGPWGGWRSASRRSVSAALGLALLLFPSFARAQATEALGAKGKQAFEHGDFESAQKNFSAAKEKAESDFRFSQSLGATHYRLREFDKAQALFSEASAQALIPVDKAAALYNLGNSLVQQQQFKEAIEAYQESLKIRSDDKETQENLSYARRLLQEQQQKKDEKKDDQQQQDKKENQQKDERNQDGQGQDEKPKAGKEGEEQKPEDSESKKDQDSQNQDPSQESDGSEPAQKQSEQQKEDQAAQGKQSPPPTPAPGGEQNQSSDDKAEGEDNGKEEEQAAAEATPTEQQAREAQSTAGAEAESKKDDAHMQALIESVEEKEGARNKYRLKKAMEQLKAEKRELPKKDW